VFGHKIGCHSVFWSPVLVSSNINVFTQQIKTYDDVCYVQAQTTCSPNL